MSRLKILAGASATGAAGTAFFAADFRARQRNRIFDRRSFEIVSNNLTEFEFKRAFRMNLGTFRNLCQILDPLLRKDKVQGARSSAGVLNVEV